MTPHEHQQIRDIEAFNEGVRHSLRHECNFHTETRDGQTVCMTSIPRNEGRTTFQTLVLLCMMAANGVRVLLMIWDKLDNLESHAIEQTMRERNKEGR